MLSRTDGEPNLDVGRLRTLREVSLRGSIAAAARTLGLTPSAVSQQLTVLEREAGTRLLDRTSRGVELTGAGLLLCERADAILDVLALARADLDRLHGAVHGPLRLATVSSAAATIVSDAVLALRATQPGIAVSVVVAEPTPSLALLHAGDVDIAVVDEYDAAPFAVPDQFQAEDLCSEDLVAIAPQGVLPDGPVRLADLAELDWVMPPEAAACGAAVRSACRRAGFEPRLRWETDDMLLLERAVAAGHGVAVLPRLAVAGAAQVDVRGLAEPRIRRTLRTLVRTGWSDRPVVRAMRAALAEASA
ncbi:MAG TPA: LysR family transcriptional regulator [Jatrophihabitantaceae bacterium]|jgi:DNA-binding transcriptional LysR family regulator|nr:LysR family transcriptional regulator [Jatrophihabitantaceae bacterium]